MNDFAVGDLVISTWDKHSSLINDIGIITGKVEGFSENNKFNEWTVFNVYWMKAKRIYPVFAYDLRLFGDT